MELKDIPHIDELSGIDRSFDSTRIIKDTRSITDRSESSVKVLSSIQEAIRATGLKDGMTISFHHHFRNGDYVLNMVLDEIAAMGIRDLTLAPSSLQEIHEPLIEHIKQGVVRRIETSGLRGKLAGAISHGLMEYPVVFRSHGGRAYAIETGKLKIDVAFLGAPACDPFGNANGYSREDDHSVICGSLLRQM